MSELWNEQLDPNGNQPSRLFKGFLIGLTIAMLFFWIPIVVFLLSWLVK